MRTTEPTGRFSRRFITRTAGLAAAGVAACCLASLRAADIDITPINQFQGRTAPSEKRAQNFDLSGVVHHLHVKEGDVVAKDQLLAEQNTEADKARLESLKIKAKSHLEYDAEKATLDKDQVELTRDETLLKQHALSKEEYEAKSLDVIIDGFKAQKAQEDQLTAKFDVDEQDAHIRQKMLKATIDGIVSEINTHEGELANSDTQHPTVTIVKNDPLYVEVDLPAEIVRRIKASPKPPSLGVQYIDEGEKGEWHSATIHFIKPEANAKSNTEHVQLEMRNPQGRSSGLQVTVKVPDEFMGSALPAAAAASAAGH